MPPRTDREDRGRPSMRGRGASHRDEAIEAGRHKGWQTAALDAGDRHASPTSNHPDRVEFVELFPADVIAVALASAVSRSASPVAAHPGPSLRQSNAPPALAPAKLSAQRRGERPERDRKAIAVALAKPRPRAGNRYMPNDGVQRHFSEDPKADGGLPSCTGRAAEFGDGDLLATRAAGTT